MKTPFFITGLPRSRTAWVANWLTTYSSLCYHDVPYSKNLLRTDKQVGFSGPETAMDFEKARLDFPDAPWLVLVRDSQQAKEAFRRWAGDTLPADPKVFHDFWDGRCELIKKISGNEDPQCAVIVVSVERLDDESMARYLWSMLGIESSFDVERWKLLRTLNVQQDKKGAKRWPLAR